MTATSTRTHASGSELTSDSSVSSTSVRRQGRPSGFVQWQVLTARSIWTMVRHGELVVAVIAPLIFTVGFYLPLKFVMQLQGIDYAQFLMPIIVLQAMAFTAISASQRASSESLSGLNTRLQTMPVVGAVPLVSRISSGVVRSVVSLTAALSFGYVIGFRFSAGLGQAVLFCAFALAISTMLSVGADAIGTLSKSPESTSQMLTLPQLILGMASCGFVPESGFPEWIRPWVRNQPISQFSFSMRDMAEGGVSFHVLFPSLIWIFSLLAVFIPLALWASSRRS
ncbi:antibiotic transporter [Rhodococcus sp. PAMC28707]|uniref:ABC transporter permease n=1 Tax=unclassified Rhodococcus (in: high G+C Gram-positive bacteria) TaxID=192944 RepID=UPI00109DE296|nr:MULTISPECIES: ABC transporter permease [unclassified Rhodococcus (in: high G+C Gram-positive bacteria)]QCB50491.1 antibiotic transporter [Rhodococcus sp. PAMC28705]QCB57817.1 antibiotic transporter [Rhodococcus sp. PAMC28707]